MSSCLLEKSLGVVRGKSKLRFEYGEDLMNSSPVLTIGESKLIVPVQTLNVCAEAEARFIYAVRVQKVVGQNVLACFLDENSGVKRAITFEATLLLKQWGEPTAIVLAPHLFAGWITGKETQAEGRARREVRRPFDVRNIPVAETLWTGAYPLKEPLLRDADREEAFVKRYLSSELRRPYPKAFDED